MSLFITFEGSEGSGKGAQAQSKNKRLHFYFDQFFLIGRLEGGV